MKSFLIVPAISLILFVIMICNTSYDCKSTINENEATSAPIDGGLGILIAAGALYGGRKLYLKKKEKKNI